ncbi:MAG: response regulator [Oscillospiraceae bacterium]|jgi:CheY-like chemotaxis protein|nr:response regulator [Oscillospiraceae bacterium]
MIEKERLLKLSELDSNSINQMEDSQLGVFSDAAASFINEYPMLENNIKDALKADDRSAVFKSLSAVCEMLRRIYAENLAAKCSDYIGKAEGTPHEDLQTFVIDFLKAVSALSIDLQMLEHQDISKAAAEQIAVSFKAENNILAVDDVNFFLRTIKSILRDSGYNVTCVNSGSMALDYLKAHKPDLFILDIDMPEMDGYELAREIKNAGHTAPIIFLTGNARKDSVAKAVQAGAVDFIIKPVRKDHLLERIGKYIKPETKEDE